MKVLMKRLVWIAAVMVLAGVPAAAADDDRGAGDRDAHGAEIWLAPQSLMPPPLAHDEDFMQMFTPGAPWPVAAQHTQVFKLYGSFVGHTTQAQINTIVADLNRRHIAIALENGVLDVPNTPTPPCGGLGLMEGYGTPEQARRVAGMIKAAGGELKYLDMDEPLYNGHYSNRPHACHSPIKLLLQQMQPTIAAYREVFPNIVIGEAEPTRFPSYTGWHADLQEWLSGVRQVLGGPVAYMHLDIPWTDDGGHVPGADLPSHEPADAVTFYHALEDLRRQHLVNAIGIIEDGTVKDTTDAAWVQDARNHLQLLEGQYHLRPDHEVFQSWMPQPSRALPETEQDTLTGLVDWYVDAHRRLNPPFEHVPSPGAKVDSTIIFQQPELTGVPGNFFVPSSAVEKNKYPKVPAFKLIFWQGNPFQADGELVPSGWNAKSKTGLDVSEDRDAQYSLKPTGASSTVQVKDRSVGAYLNSADLINSRFRADPAMMITPGIDLPDQNLFPFADPKQKLYQSMKLRIPTAVSQSRPHNTVYVVSDFLFVDRTTGTKLTYEIGLFHQNPHAPPLTREGLIKTEVGLFDPNTHAYQVGAPLSPLARLNEPVEASALYSTLPWSEERRIAFTISWKNFKTAIENLKSRGTYGGSMDPADYALRQWHLNAEMQYDQTPTQLGWSLSDTTIALITDAKAQ